MVNFSASFDPYGQTHQLQRRRIPPLVEAGLVNSARCGKRIKPGEKWDLGHVDGSGHTLYQAPEHRRCNRGTATHAYQRRRKVSRPW
jgi:hypothetical protein